MRLYFFFFQAEDGIRDGRVTGVQTCALPIWRHACGSARERDEQRQRVVQHVGRDGQHEPGDRREDADPPAPRLNREPERRAEDAGEQGVSSETEERVSATELCAIWR